jgi:hypothetical protein
MIRLGLDGVRVGGVERPVAIPIEAVVGEPVEIRGWTVDEETGEGAASVAVRLDKRLTYEAWTAVARPDLLPKIGAAARTGGFAVTIPTAELRPATHRLFFVLTSASGADWSSFDITLRLTGNGARPAYYPQIVVSTAMKSGGRHVTSVLRRYFAMPQVAWSDANDGEHLLTEELLRPVIDRPFVTGFHCLGRAINVNAIAHWGFKAAVTWRNLGDVLVSLDEHILHAPEGVWRPTLPFLDDRVGYAAWPAERRLAFLVRNAIPWYLSFYVSWRLARERLMMRYEWMVADPLGYFSYLIEQLDGPPDLARLRAIVDAGPADDSNFNVGVAGRSASLVPEEIRALLEVCIREHPSEVGELLLELPWYGAAYGEPALVAGASGELFVVAEGVKRRASSHWLRTHGRDPATATRVGAAELAGWRDGSDLY